MSRSSGSTHTHLLVSRSSGSTHTHLLVSRSSGSTHTHLLVSRSSGSTHTHLSEGKSTHSHLSEGRGSGPTHTHLSEGGSSGKKRTKSSCRCCGTERSSGITVSRSCSGLFTLKSHLLSVRRIFWYFSSALSKCS